MTVKEVLYQREIWMRIQYHTVALQGKMSTVVVQYIGSFIIEQELGWRWEGVWSCLDSIII